MNINEAHSEAIKINRNWEDLKPLKQQYVDQSDFYDIVIIAIDIAEKSCFNK